MFPDLRLIPRWLAGLAYALWWQLFPPPDAIAEMSCGHSLIGYRVAGAGSRRLRPGDERRCGICQMPAACIANRRRPGR